MVFICNILHNKNQSYIIAIYVAIYLYLKFEKKQSTYFLRNKLKTINENISI